MLAGVSWPVSVLTTGSLSGETSEKHSFHSCTVNFSVRRSRPSALASEDYEDVDTSTGCWLFDRKIPNCDTEGVAHVNIQSLKRSKPSPAEKARDQQSDEARSNQKMLSHSVMWWCLVVSRPQWPVIMFHIFGRKRKFSRKNKFIQQPHIWNKVYSLFYISVHKHLPQIKFLNTIGWKQY